MKIPPLIDSHDLKISLWVYVSFFLNTTMKKKFLLQLAVSEKKNLEEKHTKMNFHFLFKLSRGRICVKCRPEIEVETTEKNFYSFWDERFETFFPGTFPSFSPVTNFSYAPEHEKKWIWILKITLANNFSNLLIFTFNIATVFVQNWNFYFFSLDFCFTSKIPELLLDDLSLSADDRLIIDYSRNIKSAKRLNKKR